MCQQTPNGVNGYHFIMVKAYNVTADGGTCRDPTDDKVATITCELTQTDPVVVPVVNGLWTPDYEGQPYQEALRRLEGSFYSGVFAATHDEPLQVEFLVSENWFTLDIGTDKGCSDAWESLDGMSAISIGYWVILPPLSGGEHEIFIAGGDSDSCAAGILKLTVSCDLFCVLAELPLIGWVFRLIFGWFGLV